MIAGTSSRVRVPMAYLAIVATACIGVATSMVAGAVVSYSNDRIAQLVFAKEANESLQGIQVQVASANDALFALRDLLDAADRPVSRGEFQGFAKRLRERFTGLRDTGWAPRITNAGRQAFEREVRGSGFPEFEIREGNAAGQLIRAIDRDVFFPILYPDPVQISAKVLGVDITFEPVRRRALLHSVLTRQPSSTPPLRLISGKGDINGFMSFLPVFGPDDASGEPRGVIYGVFEIAPMIENILRVTLHSKNISLYFYDPQKPPSDQLIYWHPATYRGAGLPIPTPAAMLKQLHWEGVLQLADQRWGVTFISESGLGAGLWQWPALLALAAGLTITAMVEAYLVMSMRRTAQLERLAEELRIAARTLEERGEKLAHVARHDPLTGLPNRMAFAEDALRIASGGPEKTHVAVLMLDLDRFKAVNDTMGHAAGDELLRKVADKLRENLRQGDIVARLGGDEFAIIQVNVRQPQAAETLARRLIEVLCQPYEIFGRHVEVGVSIGIATAEINEFEIDPMLRQAALQRQDQRARHLVLFHRADGPSHRHRPEIA
jgi:diguanylate cyclase